MNLTLIPFTLNDVPLLTRWFNEPHVQHFYSLRTWREEEVGAKFKNQDKTIESFIVYLEEKPIGYIQKYPVNHHPWPHQDLSSLIIKEAAGLDLFIGEKDYLYKGLGQKIIENFLKEHIWPYFAYCIVDPDARNLASQKLFKKCGFRYSQSLITKNKQGKKVTLELWLKRRNY